MSSGMNGAGVSVLGVELVDVGAFQGVEPADAQGFWVGHGAIVAVLHHAWRGGEVSPEAYAGVAQFGP